jgi:hypothetical protein
MKLCWRRIAIAVVVAEILGVVVLVLLVSIFGPSDFEAAKPFAERLGAWVGPISGFLFCLLGGFWVAKSASSYRVPNGTGVGVAAAFLDIALALALASGFSPLLIFSNTGRIIGGTIGGWLASRLNSAA